MSELQELRHQQALTNERLSKLTEDYSVRAVCARAPFCALCLFGFLVLFAVGLEEASQHTECTSRCSEQVQACSASFQLDGAGRGGGQPRLQQQQRAARQEAPANGSARRRVDD